MKRFTAENTDSFGDILYNLLGQGQWVGAEAA